MEAVPQGQQPHRGRVIMLDERREKVITGLLREAATYMIPWFDGKKSGNYSLTIEVVVNEGGIRDTFYSTSARERKQI